MDRSNRVPQLYGYAVCLIAIVTLLIGVANFVDAAFARADPLRVKEHEFGFPYEYSLTSFEAFQATFPRERSNTVVGPGITAQTVQRDTLTTADLRTRYEALRQDRIARVSYRAAQRLAAHGILIALAITLFVTHWRWLRARP
ncbi:MAG: hypothetical protein ABR499_19110 [Gemmatimonadaceae bacterium]